MADSPTQGLHLLLLAYRHRLLDERTLVAAYAKMRDQPEEPVEALLIAMGLATAVQVEALRPAAELHLAEHDGDLDRSLAALEVPEAVRSRIDTERGTDPGGKPELLESTLPVETGQESTAEVASIGSAPGDRFRRKAFHRGGGLGVLWRAEDREIHREVALKEIRPEKAELPAFRALFLREAEITGRLEHPGIVPVYGQGLDAEGRLYYAMRFVEGESLKEAIGRFHHAAVEPGAGGEGRLGWHNPRFRALLKRFVDACDPIAYAHARGVIHRDIKPDNIMLGPFGETLVVDWGLAKCLGRDSTSDAMAAAESDLSLLELHDESDRFETYGKVIGTPQYLSPEQASRETEQVLAWSDVYCLGATLYYLLCGRPPFDYRGDELERILHDWEAECRADLPAEERKRKRRAIERRWRDDERQRILSDVRAGQFDRPRQVRADVPPPLEAICLKAMALRPADRYPSALDLAADLNRWLDDRPVSVYRDPPTVRLTRWGRQNRGLAAGAAVLVGASLVSLVAASVALSAHNRRIAKERDRAERSLAVARQTATRSMDVLDDADFGLLHPAKAFALLSESLEAHEQLLRDEVPHPEIRAGIADIERRTGNLGRSLGFYDRPARLESERDRTLPSPLSLYRRAIDRQRRTVAEDPRDAAARRALRRAYVDLGELERLYGDAAQARAAFRSALREGAGAGVDPVGATAELGLARLDLRAGAAEAAFDHASEALRRVGFGGGGEEVERDLQPLLVEASTVQGLALRGLKRPGEAAGPIDRALRTATAFEAAELQSARSRDLLARTVVALQAVGATTPKERVMALRYLTEAIKRLRALSYANRYNLHITLELARAHLARGNLLVEHGSWTSADSPKTPIQPETDLKLAVRLAEEIPADRRGLALCRAIRAEGWALEGRIARLRGHNVEASKAFEQAVALQEKLVEEAPGVPEEADQLASWRQQMQVVENPTTESGGP